MLRNHEPFRRIGQPSRPIIRIQMTLAAGLFQTVLALLIMLAPVLWRLAL
jgi:hypothetical protein